MRNKYQTKKEVNLKNLKALVHKQMKKKVHHLMSSNLVKKITMKMMTMMMKIIVRI